MIRLGAALRLQRHLARRDLPLLAVLALLTAVALVCALGAPRLLVRTLDAAVRQGVAAQGPAADLVVRSRVGEQTGAAGAPLVAPSQVASEAAALRDRLPGTVRRVVAPATAAVLGPRLTIGADDAAPALRNGPVGVRIALLTRPDAVRATSGRLPATGSDVDVVLSAATATAASLRVGSVVTVPAEDGLVRGTTLRLRVTGVVDRRPVAGPSPWTDDGPVWAPQRDESGAGPTTVVTVLTDVAGLARATAALGSFPAVLRLPVEADRLTAADAPAVARAIAALRTHPDALAGGSGNAYTAGSSLPEAVAETTREAVSARAQATLLATGVLGTAAVALVLLGGLLATRRRTTVALLRARGAAVATIAVPALLESVVVVLVAGALATVAVGAGSTAGAALIVLVAVLATPVQVAIAARGGGGARAPANRADRARLDRVRRGRRLALEVGLVLAAAVAVLVLRSGAGLGAAAADPLLVVAPLLAAAALTAVLVRLLPPAVAGAAAVARRSRGVAGVLMATTATGARTALPLLALCIAFGLALNDGVLLTSVAAGQEAASWERLGADARATTAVPPDRVAGRPGVRSAAAVASLPGVSANLATTGAVVVVLGVDRGYAAVVAAQPDAAPGAAATLQRLGDPAGPLPVVVDADLARRMAGPSLQLQIDSRIVSARAVGTIPAGPTGSSDGPSVYADLAALHRRVPAVRADTLLVIGPGSAAALHAAGVPAADVRTRTHWLAVQRASPLVAGTGLATLLAALLLAAFAAVALVAAVLAGAPERRRVLSLLRTLGMRRRTGWWLLVADVLPLAVGGVVGGTAVGVLAAGLLDPALALAAFTGGSADPPITVPGGVVAAVAGGTLVVLALAAAVEAGTWRRDRLAEVLRVGGQG